MRKVIVSIILLALFALLGVTIATRDRSQDLTAIAKAAKEKSKDKDKDKKPNNKTKNDSNNTTSNDTNKGVASTSTNNAKTNGTTTTGTTNAAIAAPQPDGPGHARPIRVISMSWELAAPGIVANGGLEQANDSLYAKEKLDVDFAMANSMGDVERALARGGEDEAGADIAILSLPAFVASYEKLRALSPNVFFVVGQSRGREGLLAKSQDSLVKIGASRKAPKITLQGLAGEPATFLSLTMLELSGINLSKVNVVLPKSLKDDKTDKTDPKAKDHRYYHSRVFRHVEKSKTDLSAYNRAEPLLDKDPTLKSLNISSADATSLIPYVAIAPQSFIEKYHNSVRDWSRVWLEGTRKLKDDVPAAARLVAKSDGAPEVAKLLDLMGWLEFASPRENARLTNLSGRGAINLNVLFLRSWSVWRSAHVLSTPPPKQLPIVNTIIADVIRSVPGATTAESVVVDKSRVHSQKDRRILIYHWQEKELNQEAFLEQIGFIAGIFERSKLRIGLKPEKKKRKKRRGKKSKDGKKQLSTAETILEEASTRFDLKEGRIEMNDKPANPGSIATIEVFAP